MRLTWLADVLRAAGLQVIEVDGWKGRGHELTTIEGVVAHDTVTGTNWSDESVAHLLRDGRPDLAGPLAQLGLDRTGRYWLIADGKCNHNGYGEWGNQAVGIEAYNDAHEHWPAEQLNAWYRGCAAICAHLRFNEGHVLGHKETDPHRKVDPSNLDMDLFRRNVAALLRPPEDDLTPDQAKMLEEIHAWLDVIKNGVPMYALEDVPSAATLAHRNTKAIAEHLGVKAE